MDKHILAAIVGRDEAKALVLIEEFDGARRHDDPHELSGVGAADGAYSPHGTPATRHLRLVLGAREQQSSEGVFDSSVKIS